MSNDHIVKAYQTCREAIGVAPANKLLAQAGGSPGRPESVPIANQASAVASLYDAAYASGEGNSGNKPQTLEDVADAAWAKWRAPKT